MSKRYYVPPEKEVVQKYAKQVCDALNEKASSGYDNPNVVSGLASFLRAISRAYANQLNQQTDLLDKGEENGKEENS